MLTTQTPQVKPDSFLTLHYRLCGPAGDIINTFDGLPSTLTLCNGSLSPAMEECLLVMHEGERTTFHIPANQAFGEKNINKRQWVARKLLDKLADPEQQYTFGDVVQFPAPDGGEPYAGTVLSVRDDDAVLFDFNHPLAGQPLTFEVHLISVL